jgi:hypothetical protein
MVTLSMIRGKRVLNDLMTFEAILAEIQGEQIQ